MIIIVNVVTLTAGQRLSASFAVDSNSGAMTNTEDLTWMSAFSNSSKSKQKQRSDGDGKFIGI